MFGIKYAYLCTLTNFSRETRYNISFCFFFSNNEFINYQTNGNKEDFTYNTLSKPNLTRERTTQQELVRRIIFLTPMQHRSEA